MNNIIRQLSDQFFLIFERLIYLFAGFGFLAYILQYIISLIDSKQPIVSPIQLAGVTATLGGLILVGAFYKDKTDLGMNLKNSARLLLGSSILFIITYFLLQGALIMTDPTPGWLVTLFAIFSDIVMILAGITLIVALGRLVRVLPKL